MPSDSGSPIKILLVDDHPIVREGLIAMINQTPGLCVCGEAEGYHDALKKIEPPPDVAVVDLSLQDIGGLDLIKQIQARNSAIRILVLSMHDEALYAERALRAGASGYIMKQKGTELLIRAIRRVHKGEIYVSDTIANRMLGKFVGRSAKVEAATVDRLSNRELEIFELIGTGLGTKKIAERLSISPKTVESHREHIKEKLQIQTSTELARRATEWVLKEGS